MFISHWYNMLNHPRDQELLEHYRRYQGEYHHLFQFDYSPLAAPKPIYVVEFAPASEESNWIYLTLGMSRNAMPHGHPEHRLELMMYAQNRQEALAEALASLAVYPFAQQTLFGAGHTVAGNPGVGVIEGSLLTEFILTPIYFEAEDFDLLQHSDRTHTQILWATPIYLSERMFAKQQGWKTLIDLFIEQEIQPADLWRLAVV